MRRFFRCLGIAARGALRPVQRRLLVLIVGLGLIGLWQAQAWEHRDTMPDTWRHGAAMGLQEQYYYVSLYYHVTAHAC
jgi:hypothetical protein